MTYANNPNIIWQFTQNKQITHHNERKRNKRYKHTQYDIIIEPQKNNIPMVTPIDNTKYNPTILKPKIMRKLLRKQYAQTPNYDKYKNTQILNNDSILADGIREISQRIEQRNLNKVPIQATKITIAEGQKQNTINAISSQDYKDKINITQQISAGNITHDQTAQAYGKEHERLKEQYKQIIIAKNSAAQTGNLQLTTELNDQMKVLEQEMRIAADSRRDYSNLAKKTHVQETGDQITQSLNTAQERKEKYGQQITENMTTAQERKEQLFKEQQKEYERIFKSQQQKKLQQLKIARMYKGEEQINRLGRALKIQHQLETPRGAIRYADQMASEEILMQKLDPNNPNDFDKIQFIRNKYLTQATEAEQDIQSNKYLQHKMKEHSKLTQKYTKGSIFRKQMDAETARKTAQYELEAKIRREQAPTIEYKTLKKNLFQRGGGSLRDIHLI